MEGTQTTGPLVQAKTCDLSTVCSLCGKDMIPETSHYKCLVCGYRDSCCM